MLASAASMADVQPLRALHYDPSVTGPLADVVAPPYDVIDSDQRAALIARSPFNIVALDLPRGEPDPYTAAAETLASWRREGALVRDPEPAIWAHSQEYAGPDGRTLTRRGFFCRVHLEEYGPGRIRPHERTHPGPKEDRLLLTRATQANISPIFSLYSDPSQAAWQALAPFTADDPWGEVRDGDGTIHRLWRVTDQGAIDAVQVATRDAELLIADGHHRYETMLDYAREQGRSSPPAPAAEHEYILMCLVALEDPGLTIFPTHRLIRGLNDRQRASLARTIERDFHVEPMPVGTAPVGTAPVGTAPVEQLPPPPGPGPLVLGYVNGRDQQVLRLTLKSQAIADTALADHSTAYRTLDTGVLEALLLKGALGLTDDDIAHFNGLFYARDVAEALAMVHSGEYEAAFLMRPTPVRQVREIAAAGENMPPKSTYFFPKLLTGLLLNPLA